jgi:triosephosphate isomerase
MRSKIVAGNWKMNTSIAEAKALYKTVAEEAKKYTNVAVVMAPPAPYLSILATEFDASYLSAQNCHHKNSGAYTGEWSADMLQQLNVPYCIIGHSERRAYFQESDALIFEKTNACLAANITPIFCIGEELEQRENNTFFDVIRQQLALALTLDAASFEKLVIAYEPVWAIGTGKTASSDQAQEIHAFIRSLISEQYGATLADNTSILYGGSCKPDNANELFAQPDVDGGLIGGASLNAADFIAIVKANN